MSRVFISYRREDSIDITGRIYDRLVLEYGEKNIFKDVDDIAYGVDFREVIKESVEKCDVILAIIGNKWSSVVDDEGNLRLKNENDWVRIEIEAGLKKGIPVIPILVNNATALKQKSLPESLYKLLYINALSIKDDPYFGNGIAKLVTSLNKKLIKKNYWTHYLFGITMVLSIFLYMHLSHDFFNRYLAKLGNDGFSLALFGTEVSDSNRSPEKVWNSKVEEEPEKIVYKEPIVESKKESIIDLPIAKSSTNNNSFILKIGTIPKDATVKLINKNINYKWSMKLPKDKYKVLVKRRGYDDKEFTLNLNKNTYKRVQLRRQTYTLKILPNIRGATVKILNIIPPYKDNIRLNGNIKYSISVSKKGYYDKYFTLKALNENTSLKVFLKKKKEKVKKFTLKIKPIYKGKYLSTKDTKVTVKIKNIIPRYKDNILLEEGVYDISVTRIGCKERRFSTYLKSNESIKVRLCK